MKVANDDNLRLAWEQYTNRLELAKKHPAVTQFKAATLRIENDNNFTIITEGNLQQKFIESERSGLIEFLHGYFSNKLLKYGMEIKAKDAEPAKEDTKTLSAKEQYRLLVERYPLIKELKEKLKLELDY